MARPVMARECWRTACAIPSAMRSQTACVASGVISRLENPVPPVVNITFTCLWSARRLSWRSKGCCSSASRSVSITAYPSASSISFTSGPLRSSRSPAAPLSLSVITAAVNGRSFCNGSSTASSPGRTMPPRMTFANTPSLGIMQSPIALYISQWLWQSFPICVSSSTASPACICVPAGTLRKSNPSTTRFSPNAPKSICAPLSRNSSIFSKESRLTWRCQCPACASPSIPQPSTKTACPVSFFCVPRSVLIQTAAIFPILQFLLPDLCMLLFCMLSAISSSCCFSSCCLYFTCMLLFFMLSAISSACYPPIWAIQACSVTLSAASNRCIPGFWLTASEIASQSSFS